MSRIIREILYKKVSQCMPSTDPKYITSLLSNSTLRFDETTKHFELLLSPKSIAASIQHLQDANFKELPFEGINVIRDNNIVKKVAIECSRIDLVKSIIEANIKSVEPPEYLKTKSNIIVEFSSPNIAKPFHVGHLRSTIIGNYVSNINAFLGSKVYKINYLGDWGTQFGFVLLGLSKCNDEDMKSNPIKTLYNAYVETNKLAESDPTISETARSIFESLENGDSEYFDKWQQIKEYTVDELMRTYKRLGVVFDEYQWESMFRARNIGDILRLMEEQNLLQMDKEKRKVLIVKNKPVPIVKSDGSTLYLTRDIAAAVDRFQKHKFDAMYYVVDNSQAMHFANLIGCLSAMQFAWANQLSHVKFGRINGMSSRQGTAVFLKDLLDEIKMIMHQKQKESATTKVDTEMADETTDILGISAVIINDFKHKRKANYDFDWNEALDDKAQSGVKLQYTHARLVSLEEKCNADLISTCDPEYIREPCVDDLILHLGQFDEVLYKSHEELEPFILTRYLFRLSHAINVAFKNLKVKDESPELASQRLLLFRASRNVLAEGLKILGIKPLAKM